MAAYAAGHDVLDALTLDLQHGLFDRASTAAAVRAVDAHGLAPLVRLPPSTTPAWGSCSTSGSAA